MRAPLDHRELRSIICSKAHGLHRLSGIFGGAADDVGFGNDVTRAPDQTPAEAARAEYWSRLYGRWESLDLVGATEFMRGFNRPWWVVGGWAIDAFTEQPRAHDDMDLSIFASDVAELRRHVSHRWHLWNLDGETMKPLTDQHPDVFHPSSQVWVRQHGDGPWMLDVPLTPDVDGWWVNKFMPHHRGPLERMTWVAGDGVRYLNPEIVLWFKARVRRSKDDHDFARTWPRLAHSQQA